MGPFDVVAEPEFSRDGAHYWWVGMVRGTAWLYVDGIKHQPAHCFADRQSFRKALDGARFAFTRVTDGGRAELFIDGKSTGRTFSLEFGSLRADCQPFALALRPDGTSVLVFLDDSGVVRREILEGTPSFH